MAPESIKVSLETIVVGYLETNCYLLFDSKRDAVLIDPGGSADKILPRVDSNYCKLKYILLTHGHSDHMGGLEGVLSAYPTPVLLHTKEVEFLNIPREKVRRFEREISSPGYRALENGDMIDMGGWNLEVIFTPGHTPGGVCYHKGGDLFTGDTLFMDGVGRTDFRGGNAEALMNSIRNRLLPLGDGVRIYPGHGPSSTIGREKGYY